MLPITGSKQRLGVVAAVALALAGLIFAPGSARASSMITFTNSYSDSSGTGFGSITSILEVQSQNTGYEYGSVAWNGSADVTTGTKTGGAPKTQTVLVS